MYPPLKYAMYGSRSAKSVCHKKFQSTAKNGIINKICFNENFNTKGTIKHTTEVTCMLYRNTQSKKYFFQKFFSI